MGRAAKYTSKKYDDYLGVAVDGIKAHVETKDDDWLTIVCGETGAGKSHLALHMMDHYLGERSSVKFIGLDQETIAAAFKNSKDVPRPRALMLDEANINKRNSQTRFNKEMIDMYSAIRGLNIFHIWCNPSLDMLDKFFIQERLKGVYYCMKTGVNLRCYYYFTQNDILDIFNKYGSLKIPEIHKVRRKYARYRGWWRAYDGPLLPDYLKLKRQRMDEKVEEFFVSWGAPKDKELLKTSEVAKKIGVTSETIKSYFEVLLKREILVPDVNYFVCPLGRVKVKNTVLDDVISIRKERASRQGKNIKSWSQQKPNEK